MKVWIACLLCVLSGCSSQASSLKGREIQASEILEHIGRGEHLYLDSCIVWGDLDFTKLPNRNRIASNLTQVFVESSVTFHDCLFVGEVRMFDSKAGVCVEFAHNLSFTHCDFRKEADFTEVIVGGHVFFTGSIFHKRASWQGSSFRHKKVYFNEVTFEDEALFQEAIFAGEGNFLHTVFHSSAMFQKIRAGGLLFFGHTQFKGYVDFTYATAPESQFLYAEFGKRYDFGHSQLHPMGLPENITIR